MLMTQFADCLATKLGREEPGDGRGRRRARAKGPDDDGRRPARASPSRGRRRLPDDVPKPPEAETQVREPASASRRSRRREDDVLDLGAVGREALGRRAAGPAVGLLALLAAARPVTPEEQVTDSAAAIPFTRSNLREQIQDVLLQRIVEGTYRPGERIVETRIAQELGVSQGPVREALRDLEQLGCVVHEPGRGCSVRAFSAEELLEAFPVRAALEALAARLAAERITRARAGRARPAARAHARRGAPRRRPRPVAGQRVVPRDDRARRAQRDARAPVADARALLAHLPDGVAPGHRPRAPVRPPRAGAGGAAARRPRGGRGGDARAPDGRGRAADRGGHE